MILLIALLGTWIQASVLRLSALDSLFGHQGVVANIPIIMVIFLAFYEPTAFGAILAFLIGLELDLFSGVRVGPWAGTFVLIFGLIACFAQRIFVESGFAAVVAVFFASLLGSAVYLLFMLEGGEFHGFLATRIVGEALLSALLAPFVFRLMRRYVYTREHGGGRMGRQRL